MFEERFNRAEATATADTSLAGGIRPGRAQVQEAPESDDGRFEFGAFAARYRPESFSGEGTAWRDWSQVFRTWAGRFQRGREQEVIRAVDARPGDAATVTELDLKLEDWTSAELKSVAADFYHALILCCKGKALKVVLTNKEGQGFEAWRALVNKYEPTSKASVVGKLAEILRTPKEGDLFDAITTFERNIMIYEAQSWETISDFLKIDCVIAGMGHSSMKEHLLLSATNEHAKKTISAPTPMEIDSFQSKTATSAENTDTPPQSVGVRTKEWQRRLNVRSVGKHHGQFWTRSYTSLHKESQQGGWKLDRKEEMAREHRRVASPKEKKVEPKGKAKVKERKDNVSTKSQNLQKNSGRADHGNSGQINPGRLTPIMRAGGKMIRTQQSRFLKQQQQLKNFNMLR